MRLAFPFLVTALIYASVASANQVIVETNVESLEYSASFQQNQYLAQQFTIPAAVSIDSASITLYDNLGPEFSGVIQITDAIGETATSGDVLLTTPIQIPAGSGPNTVFASTPVTLSAGTYYLLISTTDPLPLQTRWLFGGSATSNTLGTAGAAYFSGSQNVSLPVASPFFPLTGYPTPFLAFQIVGTPVPEMFDNRVFAIGLFLALPACSRVRSARPAA